MNDQPNESRTVTREQLSQTLELQAVFTVLEDDRIVEEMQPKSTPFSESQFSSLTRAKNHAYEMFIEKKRNLLREFQSAKRERFKHIFRFLYRLATHSEYRQNIRLFNSEMVEIESLSQLSPEAFFQQKLTVCRLPDTFIVKQLLNKGTPVFFLTLNNALRTGKMIVIQDRVTGFSLFNASDPDESQGRFMVQYHTDQGIDFDFENNTPLSKGEWPSSSSQYRLFETLSAAKGAANELRQSLSISLNTEQPAEQI